MDLEKERRIRPPGAGLFLLEKDVLKDPLYDEKEIMIPAGCQEIGTAAFLNNLYIEQASVPSSTHTIGDAAFSGYMYINRIILQEGLKKIMENAFYLSGLKWILLPDTLEELGRGVSRILT